LPRRISGNCAKHQRQLTVAIKRARHIALLPYTRINMMKNKSSLHLEFAGCFFVCFCLLYSFFCARKRLILRPALLLYLSNTARQGALLSAYASVHLEKSAKLFIYNEKSVVTNIQLRAENAEPGRTSLKKAAGWVSACKAG